MPHDRRSPSFTVGLASGLLLALLTACTSGASATSGTSGPAATPLGTAAQTPAPASSPAPSTPPSTSPSPSPSPSLGPGLEEDRPGTPGWAVPSTAGRTPGLEAYAGRVSVRPGEPVRLFVATPSARQVAVRAFRIGPYGGAGAREVWSGTVEGSPPPTARPDDGPIADAGGLRAAGLVTERWTSGGSVPTDGWPEGHYLLRLDAGPASRYVPLTVRSADARGAVLVIASAMTWQAYNTWGGASLYGDEGRGKDVRKATAVSFDRPYADGFGSGRFLTYDAPVAVAAQRLGVRIAWATDVDVARDPGLVSGASAVVVGGHAEYWTAGMRDAVEAAVADGTNLAVFGANTAYWRVRLVGGGRLVVGTKSAARDPLAATDPRGATARFRDAPDARPEELLTGMRYDCFPARADWVVADASWWGYAGTGVTTGSRLAGLVGPESDRVYAVPDRPRPTQVVAYTRFACGGRGGTAHTGVYAVRPSGAGVFSTGTMYWPCALSDGECLQVPDPAAREVVRTVTRNVLREFAQPRAGTRLPASDTVDRFWLPARSTTGAS